MNGLIPLSEVRGGFRYSPAANQIEIDGARAHSGLATAPT
ncbi:hypothetical protein MAHJHV63_54270 [Mycobacterium avium subsp. hominissuis]